MPFYITLITERESYIPDNDAMIAAIRTATSDPTAVLISHDGVLARGKKAAAWTVTQTRAAQTLLDTTAELTPQVVAQRRIDQFPIEFRALVLTLIDALNVLRTHPAIGLPAITPTQAITAIRSKAATL